MRLTNFFCEEKRDVEINKPRKRKRISKPVFHSTNSYKEKKRGQVLSKVIIIMDPLDLTRGSVMLEEDKKKHNVHVLNQHASR